MPSKGVELEDSPSLTRPLLGDFDTSAVDNCGNAQPQLLAKRSNSILQTETRDEYKAAPDEFPSIDVARLDDLTFIRLEGQDGYVPIDSFEGRVRFDPSFTWTVSEEQKLVRKIDLRICTWCCLTFFALQLDRGNLTQALTDNMLDDLGLNTNNYNYGQSILYVSFLFAELPSQLISKKLGPDNWIPCQMVMWSLVAAFQAFLTGKTSFYVTRSLLGLIEGGFIPDTVLYLSYWYKSRELPRRLAFFWTSSSVTSIIGAFLAAAILSMGGINGTAGWRWLFALEGTITGVIGIATYFYLPPSPYQTSSWFRGRKGWFTDHEEKIMANRILRDDPSKGDMHNREAISFTMIWRAFADWEMWPIYLLGLSFLVPNGPAGQYLTLILREFGFTRFQTNMLSVLPYILFIFNLQWLTWLSEKINQRFSVALISQLWCLPLLVILAVLPNNASRWTRYILTTLLMGTPYGHAILVSLASRNAGSVRTRTIAAALYNMAVQLGSVYGSEIYRDEDKPYYRVGNRVLIGLTVYNTCLFVGAKIFYIWRNKIRERRWLSMSQEDQEAYLRFISTPEGKWQGNKMLTFRFSH